jgi:hypothetical protein
MKFEECIKIALGESQGKNPLGRYRRRWGEKTGCILNTRDVLD